MRRLALAGVTVAVEVAILSLGTIDRLADAIKERYGDRVQRVGFYTIGSTLDTDPDALSEVIRRLKTR